jgi:hypothetical protein
MHTRLLLPLVLLLGGVVAVRAQENLVRNPGFESPATAQGLPGDGWWVYEARGTPDVKVDARTARNGKASARLQAEAEARFVLVSPKFAVSPGDDLRFEVWARGENLGSVNGAYAGLAFRAPDGRVTERRYVRPQTVGGGWVLLATNTAAPADVTSAEVHLGYSNRTGALWFDDVSAEITSPLSLSLVEPAKPWVGSQDLLIEATNRRTNAFRGTVRVGIARQTNEVPVSLPPRGAGLVFVPIKLPAVGLHNYTLTLEDEAGAKLRVLQGRFRALAPMMLHPASPCYHAVGEGDGTTCVDARIAVAPQQRKDLRLAVELRDTAGRVLQSAMADASAGDTAGVDLRVPVSAVGEFVVQARLLDGTGTELAAAQTDVKVRPRAESQVGLGADGFLRVNGQPHFTIGMYSCGRYDEMGKAGFSGTHNYGITTGDGADAINPNEARLKELLDQSHANGMRMMVELPRKAIEKAQWEQIRRRILTFRRHPGLLCWGSEERVARGEAPLANVAALYKLVKELDPDHPLVLGDTRDVVGRLQQDRRSFFPDDCMDIGIWWWYPIPQRGTGGDDLQGRDKQPANPLEPPSWLTTTLSKKPLWIAIQSYQHPRPDARFPTPAEYRALAYLSIINGVKGLWFYTGSGQRDWQGEPAGLLNKPVEGRWDYVQQLVRELREFSPVIMADPGTAKLTLASADAPVEFITRQLDGALYVIAANKSDQPQSVRFTGEALAGKRAKVLYETHEVAIQGGSLADVFPPLGVRLYRVD